MKKYLVIIPVLLIIYFVTLNFKNDNYDNVHFTEELTDSSKKIENKDDSRAVMVSYNSQNLEMKLDDYITGVLACEMPASFNIEALKAGAIAARTFYLYKKNINSSYVATVNDQCFINESEMRDKWGQSYDKYYNIIKKAVDETSNMYITYNGDIVESFYFSMSNGFTENIENVFSEKRPYLVSVSSSWEKKLPSYEKTIEFTKNEFLSKLALENTSTIDINIISRSESGRINSLSINGVNFKGTEFRKKLGLRSTDASISILDDKVKIVTRGYGHGVGLSQYGANEMAKLGYKYDEIIKYYYKDTDISII